MDGEVPSMTTKFDQQILPYRYESILDRFSTRVNSYEWQRYGQFSNEAHYTHQGTIFGFYLFFSLQWYTNPKFRTNL